MNVTVDEVSQSMDELGLDAADLLDDDNVQQLVLNIKDADNIDMLVDESLGQYMSEISDNISEIVADSSVSVEELTAGEKTELTKENSEEKLSAGIALNGDETKETININGEKTVTTESSGSTEENVSTQSTETAAGVSETAETGQSETQNSSDFQNQQNDTLDSNLVDGLAQALTDAVSAGGEVSDFEGDVEAADIVRQVVEEIKTNINDKVRSLELRLNPENLGRVQISVTTKNGVMQARIIAENEAAKNAIEGSLSLLKETFNEQNLKVEAVEVTIANYDFFKEDNEPTDNENNQKNTSSRGNDDSGNDDIVKEELSDAEQLEKDMMQQTGNSISYTV
jgi:flagellar hook-length control protein FliK